MCATTPSQTPQPRGERALIRRIGESTPAACGGVPFGDDMAGLDGGLLWTVDMLMDGVDFDSQVQGWEAIGRKALAVNLSDCAAMAVQPVAALCAVALADELSMDDALALHRGVAEFGRQYGCAIVGGDTNSWASPTVISITVAGRALPDCPPVRRDGARPGETIWVTGRLGGSILGRHMTFEPRVALAQHIARRLRPSAMMDISDGLAIDLDRLCEASHCGAVLDAAGVDAAIHADARELGSRDGRPAREHALHDGEDFELLVTVPPSTPAQACLDLGLLPVGRTTAERGLFLDEGGVCRAVPAVGWEHFR